VLEKSVLPSVLERKSRSSSDLLAADVLSSLRLYHEKFHYVEPVPVGTPTLTSTDVTLEEAVACAEPVTAKQDSYPDEVMREWQRLAQGYREVIDNGLAVRHAQRGEMEEAVELWKSLASEAECDKALYNLGLCYERGLGVACNIEQAETLYRQAASHDNAKAAFNLAMLLLQRCDHSKPSATHKRNNDDSDEAFTLLTKAAELGLAEAQRELGVLYTEGRRQNMYTAAQLFEKASDQNDIKSCFNLAICCERGLGVTRDESRAVELYRRAASAGHPDALFNLATFYENGLAGLDNDKAVALHLYKAAQSGGNVESEERIKKLEELQLTSVTELKHCSTSKESLLKSLPQTSIVRNRSSGAAFPRLLSTGSDAGDSSSSCDDDGSLDWESYIIGGNTRENSKLGIKGARIHDDKLTFGRKKALRAGFYVGFSSDEEEDSNSDDVRKEFSKTSAASNMKWGPSIGKDLGFPRNESEDFIDFDETGVMVQSMR